MKRSALIGYTGFVGSNLVAQHEFSELYNSKNIDSIVGKKFDVVVCAGVSAVKWLANQEPENDTVQIEKLKKYLEQVKVAKFILISTIDIYDNPEEVDEDSLPNASKQDSYGKHRYQLEQWVIQKFPDSHILRLPGLFGENLKKNLIFDILNPLAKAINRGLWQEIRLRLDEKSMSALMECYQEDEFGNLQLKNQPIDGQKKQLIDIFAAVGFSTLNFTDSRSSFQFYDLGNLWRDIQFMINNNIKIFNLAAEPITVNELISFVLQREFINYTDKGGVNYNIYTKHAKSEHYLYTKHEVLTQIKAFIEKETG